MTIHQAVRRWIMTGGVAAVTITGTMYGAGLKGDQTAKQTKKKMLEATPDEIIAQLEFARADLVLKKNEMERKIARFKERRSEERGQTEPK
ncbi:uncharacterized protein K460DRAFT_270993 [Cucurbitaria berberidis CBS 394.84]|uniref:Uncharacterized protein n=1 Tax=Cucurbitaria berberidis CBS 394.84 TaxID=1168544 RepID=A0A9P4LDG6_9PLEO|nr:uncharacterized protein K460DRAFT_270993 [Cucurbitaria berberidis CBS 394.84]KAF1851856.1 hypothetical protein K460DRAFT_270993 [Cucurbitaria berberidis CBS 394.84]